VAGIYEGLNPARLKSRLEELREQLEAASASKTEVVPARHTAGPKIRGPK
jgi:hypothetical protein